MSAAQHVELTCIIDYYASCMVLNLDAKDRTRHWEIVAAVHTRVRGCLRDSLNLLPGKLNTLAKNPCPGLGPKGSIPYDEVRLSNLASLKTSLLDYMKQDILLLGGVLPVSAMELWNDSINNWMK
ncbi:hypothetical protein JRO89_XS06G0118500 [Xanthoceras sorbifolium]|uniref:Uncharacterized protein n=1 Tax=Xanthoceras sorbifolium TaxID=99658 RepID=A0ABQ8HXS9_9ROSI|nr:hypothetical protein JRO89_XS06G0118500 [Xanthoceras sorbifolium]